MKFKIFCIIFIAIFLGGSVFLNGQADTLKAEASAKEAGSLRLIKKRPTTKPAKPKNLWRKLRVLKQKKQNLKKK